MTPVVATALDLPFGSTGDGVELFLDLYTGDKPLIPARGFMLAPRTSPPDLPSGLQLLNVPSTCLSGHLFKTYVHALREALSERIDPSEVEIVHLQHLTFGGAPALIHALPTHPRIALVHSVDLSYATSHPDQLAVLRETAHAVDAIVVPTDAMADRLVQLDPTINRRKITKIPWGVPDHLLATPTPHPVRRPAGSLRLLYAGRLTPEKGVESLLRAMTVLRSIELSIVAPRRQFHALTPLLRLLGVRVRYLGWLSRPQLWNAFA
ncbi:glycosyltransferase, partial [Streptomyces sp. NPDC051133]|uniref:glycosyltransferase n=1 Tax=Streptomyces sp. NPDC051133 TaxID=3155521 RepID=UPI00342EBB02